MQQLLKEKLWAYIVHNNPDLMHHLQDEYRVVQYLEEKVSAVMPTALSYLEKDIPGYAILELCMEQMTKELKPSRYNYIVSLLSEEFEDKYIHLRENGLLAYEVVNMVEYNKEVFDSYHFSEQNETDSNIYYGIAGKVMEYFENSGK